MPLKSGIINQAPFQLVAGDLPAKRLWSGLLIQELGPLQILRIHVFPGVKSLIFYRSIAILRGKHRVKPESNFSQPNLPTTSVLPRRVTAHS